MDPKGDTQSPIDRSGGDRDSADVTEHSEHFDPLGDRSRQSDGKNENGQKAANAKDPSRPRRKKARRACFACQRAHLTCGDERPCQRCIKRGLQDACHDGIRKKAKYLHDAPDGALVPGIGANFFSNGNSTGMTTNLPSLSRSASISTPQQQPQQPQQQTSSTRNFFPTPQAQSQPPSAPYNVFTDTTLTQSPFPTQSPVSPTFNLKTGVNGRNASLSSTLGQQATPSTALSGDANSSQNPFAGPFFDPSDPALFNFDLSSMNFENRYGALEFGMLGHMATGAGDSPTDSAGGQRGSIGRSGSAQFSTPAPGFSESPGTQQPFLFGDPLLNDWSTGQASGPAHVNVGGVYAPNGRLNGHMKADAPHAFAIESGPPNFASPGSATASPHVTVAGIEDPAALSNSNPSKSSSNPTLAPSNNGPRPLITTPSLKHRDLQVGPRRRHRNPSLIYESVKEPYGYTSGFHNLTACIQRRFSPQKTLRIAKALASIRPSFIATTKTLNRDDLIFMEKCFQRTLFEYEDFINACGTPTIVCRRTGEIAAVGKEFSILTGWKKDVLLGKEPNLNVNTGASSLPQSGTTSRGSFTPRSSAPENSGRPQPVFLAELLDDDSVVEFYEDFARLAFGDSRGSVMTRCKLLKYKTKEEEGASSEEYGKWNNHIRKGGIAGEAGMNQLGSKDGKVECAYCWTVKRDVFDIPMLIVMNFLPCI
ncbi:Transcription activator of gluconeogenesis acuK [Penicillium ucsense]|uniref:Transcription activator of gluconeogenesis acuK n=1 Tax=Penicillium ucsense TaxID=2839758 RepID=A0A8J8W652_9EURO|nr:Transcription activator of gluconeogenesis acuK [Penicillium ucsense]KAF7737810.1 Transcription activator of gluconeogenesis acuK [Penicillium ucsense]